MEEMILLKEWKKNGEKAFAEANKHERKYGKINLNLANKSLKNSIEEVKNNYLIGEIIQISGQRRNKQSH